MADNTALVRKSYSHWSCVGFYFDIMSLFWLLMGLCLTPLALSGPSVSPEAGTFIFILLSVLVLACMSGIVWRPSRVMVERAGDVITVTKYRFFGTCSFSCCGDRKEYDRNELGALILDTQYRYSCFTFQNCILNMICGFNGLYVTKGLPRKGSVDIAFEIPFYYTTHTSSCFHGCYVRTFEKSFHALAEMMEFVSCDVMSQHHQRTKPASEKIISGGTGGDHMLEMAKNMQYQMEAENADAKANFRNYLAFNRLCCTPLYDFFFFLSSLHTAFLTQ